MRHNRERAAWLVVRGDEPLELFEPVEQYVQLGPPLFSRVDHHETIAIRGDVITTY